MARQTARRVPDLAPAEPEIIPPDSPEDDREPIAASGAMADLNPQPVTPRPREEEAEIEARTGRYGAPPPSLWSSLWVVVLVIAALIIIATVFWSR